MDCSNKSCLNETVEAGRYKGKKICDFPDGDGGFVGCDKKYVSLDDLSPGCSDVSDGFRDCCKLSTCITKKPTITTNIKNTKNNLWIYIILGIVAFIFIVCLILLYVL
jgi:hypothetical protein